jgi:chorismate mutase
MTTRTVQELQTLIDALDADLACLLQRRFELALEIRDSAGEVNPQARDLDVLNHWYGLAQAHHLSRPFTDQFVAMVTDESKRIEKERK